MQTFWNIFNFILGYQNGSIICLKYTRTHLMFPLLVLYLMWLQIASNMPLVVVTDLQSNTYTRESRLVWRIFCKRAGYRTKGVKIKVYVTPRTSKVSWVSLLSIRKYWGKILGRVSYIHTVVSKIETAVNTESNCIAKSKTSLYSPSHTMLSKKCCTKTDFYLIASENSPVIICLYLKDAHY